MSLGPRRVLRDMPNDQEDRDYVIRVSDIHDVVILAVEDPSVAASVLAAMEGVCMTFDGRFAFRLDPRTVFEGLLLRPSSPRPSVQEWEGCERGSR